MMNKSVQEHVQPMHNERGVIAQQYSELQAVPILERARTHYSLPKGSAVNVLKVIFQSTEIALLNMADLMKRASQDIKDSRYDKAEVKLFWLRAFHSLMVQLASMPEQLGIVPDRVNNSTLSIASSPAYRDFFVCLKQLDAEISSSIHKDEIPIDFLLSTQTLDNPLFHLLHLARVCNHETTTWDYKLHTITVPTDIPDYEEFVASALIHQATIDTTLQGDTYYMQFRGLHQIPELLCAEINDQIEVSIQHIRTRALQQTYESLRYITILANGVNASLQPMVDCLTTTDYHTIRENLGLTSGSHSVNIHFHLFKDLYEQLWDSFAQYLLTAYHQTNTTQDIESILRSVDQNRFTDTDAFLAHLLANELLKLRSFIREWRNSHIHLPRNNVGGSHTRSLTGSPDAVQTVKKMRNTAIVHDPLHALAQARKIGGTSINEDKLIITAYINSPESLDNQILTRTGKITQERFKHVQERTGFFSQKSPFVPPPRREV